METTIEANLVQKILELDHRVRFVGIINEEGQLIKGGMRQGMNALEPTKKDEDKLYLKWFLIQAMTDEWNKFLGDKILLYTRHEKIDMYGIPLGNSRILLVSAERIREPPFFGDRLLELAKENRL
jgi:hypothetical protein